MAFSLADGTAIERKGSECHIVLPQGEGHTPVLNPFNRTVKPMRKQLASYVQRLTLPGYPIIIIL